MELDHEPALMTNSDYGARMAYKFEPVCGAGRGRKLRSRSAALAAAISVAVRGRRTLFFFVMASICAFVGGFGGRLWVWVPVLTTWP